MISEEALSEVCRPAILGRGQIIARSQGSIWKRKVSYVEKGSATHTVLQANVDSSTGYQDHYKAQITIDEADDVVLGYRCTCPAASRYAGPCKHSIALAIDFNKNASIYEGYNEWLHVSTSNVLTEYLDRNASTALRPIPVTDEPPHSVRLGATLVRDRDMLLRLDVSGQHGTYVVRSVSTFVSNVLTGSWAEYGKKLAFTHTLDAFDDESRELATFVVRCVQNRRAYAAERLSGHAYGGAGGSLANVGRELRLSPPELDELIDLFAGKTLQVEAPDPAARGGAGLHAVQVLDGDPELELSIAPAGNGAFELVRAKRFSFFSTGSKLYAFDNAHLWRCSRKLMAASGFLTSVWDSSVPQILLGEADAQRFVAGALPALEKAVQVSVPAELDELRPVPVKITFCLDRTSEGVTCDVVAAYGDETYYVLRPDTGVRASALRDLETEVAARRVVGTYFTMPRKGAQIAYGAHPTLAFIPDKSDEAIARLLYGGLEELARVGEVQATEAFQRLIKVGAPKVKVGISVKANLIDLGVSADDLPLDELYALLASYRRKQRFHRLRDGSFVDLAGADLSQAARLAEELGLTARELASGGAHIPPYKAFLLEALMSDDEKDASFREYLESFRSVDLASYEPPAELAVTLRPYQVTGYQWLNALVDMGFGGILADEMGLGKSLQLISLLVARRWMGKTLVVCPASLVYNWQAEFEKFAPQVDVAVVAGTAPERARIRRQTHEVYITSYDLVRRDIESWARIELAFEVLDEAQFIKNHETLAARAVKALDARYRFALTGTPIENRLSELWSIFDYLMPGLLGSYDRFRERYEQPIIDGDDEVAARLRAAVGPFVLRRLKSEVLRDLPDKLEQVVYAHMDSEQRALYAAHEQALRVSLTSQSDAGFNQGKLQVLAELTRLRQICCDPRLLYDDYEGASCKLDTVMQLVESIMDGQEKMLIFSQFTSYLSIIASELDHRGIAYYTITGATPKRRRVELVDQFNADQTPVFLISLKAGGTGLNLVGASAVIHADPWWNAAAQNQATDRAHRIGQVRDVTVYKVIARDTIEERIVLLQEAKSDLADQVVGEGGGLSLASLRKEDLIDLLGE